MIILRDYQRECVESIVANAKKGVTRQAIIMATGSGKTCIFTSLVPLVKAKGKKTLILAHRSELLEQAKEKLLAVDDTLKVGIEQADRKCDASEDVTIASVPTLGRAGSKRIEKFNPDEYGLIIQDEMHHATADSFKRVYEYFDVLKGKIRKPNGRVLLGFTATPNRADKVGLDEIFDKITFNYTLRQGIDGGYLSNIQAYSVQTQEDISQVHTRMGDFADNELAEAVDTNTRNRLVVESYTKIAPHTKTLVFAAGVEHAKNLSYMFASAGYITAYVIGTTPRDERKELLRKFDTGKIEVIVNVGVLTEGFDQPDIKTILMARPTKSSVLFSQILGRGTRVVKGKDHLKLIDFVDNTGKNTIVTLPNLFGIPKQLKGINGKKITDVADTVEKILEVNPDYNVGGITDWSKENIEKVIKRIDIFAQAELPEEVKDYSKFAWERYKEGWRLQFPVKEDEVVKETITIQPNILNAYEIRLHKMKKVEANYETGYKKWVTFEKVLLDSSPSLGDALKVGDGWVTSNKSEFKTMFAQNAEWRKDIPSEKQVLLLKKLGVPVPAGISKGQASVLIGKALNNKQKFNS